MKKTLLALLAGSFAAASQAGALIDLAAEAGRPAANDMVRASVYSEASGSNPADLARQVNGNIGEALKLIREKKGVTVKSGNQSTYPIYTQSRKIDGWRMRSELLIESRDFGAVSELLGRLQQMRLAVGDIAQMPSPETRRQVEDEAMREAIRAFQNRAAVVAEQLGKGWKIKQMHINQGGGSPVPIMRGARAAMLAADAAPAPIEAGESTITTHVTGQIELED
ncbi:MAG: SIMPL domain-containing protein [Azonexus sp.]|jgi:predicted secreted protein|nr:SIMPL domain-containing protein [Dechloromonas sp.]MBP8194927.1 SIMPL domain-containing protein [Azonexus sp.]HRF30377.1 SIMPL domain-containing protein [Azonexus sp.]